MLISRLAGVFTCDGLAIGQGRRPKIKDCGFVPGPVDILCDPELGQILEITSASAKIPDSGEVIDGGGLYATPGFIDSHSHALYAGHRGNEHFSRWGGATYLQIAKRGGGIRRTVQATANCPDDHLATLLAGRLGAMLRCGTTTVEVKSGYGQTGDDELRLLRVIGSVRKVPNLPEVFSTFLALHALPPGISEAGYCRSMVAILPEIVQEKLASFVDVFPERGFFSLQAAVRFVEKAVEGGLRPKIHADEITDMGASESFVKLGALSVDHLQQISPNSIKLLGAVDTVATVMPATSFFLGMQYANARRLIDSGACVAVAADFNPGTAPLPDLQTTNLLAASRLRMTPAEILCACTYNGAQALGISTTHGILAPRRVANLLLWDVGVDESGEHGEGVLAEIFTRRLMPAQVFVRGKLIGASVHGT